MCACKRVSGCELERVCAVGGVEGRKSERGQSVLYTPVGGGAFVFGFVCPYSSGTQLTPPIFLSPRLGKSESGMPHGMIDLAHCMTVKSAELKAQKRNALEVSTPDTTFLMYADDEKQKDDWIGAIGRAIVRCSSTYTNDDGMDDEEQDSDED